MTSSITFKGTAHSDALEADIRHRIAKLGRFYQPIMGCQVLVELAQRHHERGNHFHVRIDLTVPGDEIVIAHDGSLYATAKDIESERPRQRLEPGPERKHAAVAVREAFDVARRKLQDFSRRQRGSVKTLSQQPRGQVSQLFPIDEYGYIEAEDGHEVYFQKDSVLKNAFDRLAIGSRVAFVEEAGDKGPQASTVRVLH